MTDESKDCLPKLRFPEFRKDGEWDLCPLGPLTTKIGSGVTPRGGETNYLQSGIPFVRSQNVGWGELILNDIAFIPYEIHKTLLSTEIQNADVLLNITGASIGRCAIVNENIAGGNVNQHVCIIRPKKEKLNSIFLMQYIISQQGQKQIDSYQAGGNRQGLNFAQVALLNIPLPFLREQQKIADCLSSLDELIEAHEQKRDALVEHKKGLMQRLFPAEGENTPRWRFPEFRKEKAWGVLTFEECCNKIMDGTHFSPQTKNGDFMYLSSRNIKDGKIDLTNVEKISLAEHKKIYEKCPVKRGDILLTKDGANTGNCAINTLDYEFSLLSSVAVLRVNNKLLDNLFFYHGISTEYFKKIIKNSMFGQAITRITLEKISQFKIYFPSLPEQQKIADCLSSLDARIEGEKGKIASLREHKRGLMQRLFPQSL